MRSINSRNSTLGGLIAFFVLLIVLPLSQAHASYPAPMIRDAQVRSFHRADGAIGTDFLARLTGPSPEDVASFTATGPSGTFNLVPNISLRQYGLYFMHSVTSIVPNGNYIFEVTDRLGRSASVTKNFTYDSTLPQVDSATMIPQNGAYVGTTTPTLSFDPVPGGGVYYQVFVMDYAFKAVWFVTDRTQSTSFTVPGGLLQPQSPYWWFVRVFDSAADPQNYHESERLSFYTGTRDLPELGIRYVMSFPTGEEIGNWLGVRETNVAPWDINYLRVTGPDLTVYNLDAFDSRFYCPTFYMNRTVTPAPIPDGIYTFDIQDNEFHTATITQSYTYDPVPAVSEESRSPGENAYFDINRPTFSWAPVEGNNTYYYSLRIYDYNGSIKWYQSSPSTQTSVTLPGGLNLPWGSSYTWSVMVWDTRFPVINNLNTSLSRTFTINPYVPYPTVVSVTPADGAVRVPVDSSIVIQFSKQMDRPSVEASVDIGDVFENDIEGTFSWSSRVYPDDTVTFTPAQDLAYSQRYQILINGNCWDAINHFPLNGYREWEEHYFETVGAPGDDSAPEVMTVLPYDGQVGGYIGIGAFFSKPLDPATFTPDNVVLTGPGISGYTVRRHRMLYFITIIPDSPLIPESDYTVRLTTGLTDTEGHPLASAYEWSFNTGPGDTTPPRITQTVPADGAANAPPRDSISVYFSEDMNAAAINENTVTVYDETAAAYRALHLRKNVENGNCSSIQIMPTFGEAWWSVGHTHTVRVSQLVTDLAGNPLGEDYTFTFTVVDYPDCAPGVSAGDNLGLREHDGSSHVEFFLWAWGAHGADNLTVVATDLTQPGKVWNLTNEPGSSEFRYESEEDEALDVGYHDINFLVTDTVNGQSTNLKWNFYVFNASPSLTAPSDSSQGLPLTPTLSWDTDNVENDALYEIAVFDGPDPDAAKAVWGTIIIADDRTDYSVTLPACRALAPSTTYYWGLRGRLIWERGVTTSQLWSFTTAGPSCEEDDTGALDIVGVSGGSGATVSIPVRIQTAPNEVDSLGFEVTFDPGLLTYTGFSRGPLVQNFDFFDVANPETGLLRAGGFEAGPDTIKTGDSGNMVYLHFNVGECVAGSSSELNLQGLKDDLGGWPTSSGCFQCGCDGDVNGDGEITPMDALCTFETYLAICPTSCDIPCEEICCDVTGDGDCTPADALCIFQKYLGLPSCLD